MTNDELIRYLEAVEYEIGAGSPGAETEYALGQEVLILRAQLDLAQTIIARGVELMPLDQLSQWEGVRAWQELAGDVEAASAAKG